MLIHPTIFNPAVTFAPKAQHEQRVAAAVAYPAIHENMLSLQVDAYYITTERGECAGDIYGQVGLDDLVGIQT
ncbi:hypothetical protein D3C84_1270630 [compost metagenome]